MLPGLVQGGQHRTPFDLPGRPTWPPHDPRAPGCCHAAAQHVVRVGVQPALDPGPPGARSAAAVTFVLPMVPSDPTLSHAVRKLLQAHCVAPLPTSPSSPSWGQRSARPRGSSGNSQPTARGRALLGAERVPSWRWWPHSPMTF